MHAVTPTEMYSFTEAEITRGLQRVLDLAPDHDATIDHWLQIFLEAARPSNVDAWPASHPMHCTKCGRAITDATGRALVAIDALKKEWTCQTCRPVDPTG